MMDAVKDLIPLIFAGSLFALVLAVGMDAELRELLALFRKPLPLLKAVVAVNVIVPAAAVLLVGLWPIPHAAKAAILLMAISPVPPLVPGKQLKVGGERAYSYGLYTALILLAVVIVPLSVAVLRAIYGVEVTLPISAVVRNVLLGVVLPLAAGLLLRRFAARFAQRAIPLLRTVAMLLLVVAVIPMVAHAWSAFAPLIGNGTVLAMALVATIALAGGHLLGGPDVHGRAALAVTAATRHPGIALIIAKANTDDPRVSAAVLGFMIVGLLAAAPYQLLLKRRSAAA